MNQTQERSNIIKALSIQQKKADIQQKKANKALGKLEILQKNLQEYDRIYETKKRVAELTAIHFQRIAEIMRVQAEEIAAANERAARDMAEALAFMADAFAQDLLLVVPVPVPVPPVNIGVHLLSREELYERVINKNIPLDEVLSQIGERTQIIYPIGWRQIDYEGVYQDYLGNITPFGNHTENIGQCLRIVIAEHCPSSQRHRVNGKKRVISPRRPLFYNTVLANLNHQNNWCRINKGGLYMFHSNLQMHNWDVLHHGPIITEGDLVASIIIKTNL